MSKVIKVMGEGGIHRHQLETATETFQDGLHKHLFYVNDRLLMTDLSGAHKHSIDADANSVGPEEVPHEHRLNIQTTEGLVSLQTEDVTPHEHELQSKATTLSGIHTHIVQLGGERYLSIVPGDLISAINEKTQKNKAFKDMKVESDDPMEMNFALVKRLNQEDMKEILKGSAVRSILKSLSTLKHGYHVHALLLSRDTFSDIGEARRWVMDKDLDVRSSEEIEAEGLFRFEVHDASKFEEGTLIRIHITDGVKAVIGLLEDDMVEQAEAEEPVEEARSQDSLTENAVASENTETTRSADELEQLQSSTPNEETPMGLKEKFSKVSSIYNDSEETSKSVTKKQKARHTDKKPGKKTRKLIDWKTGEKVTGELLQKLKKIADDNGVKRKYVTIEYPQKRFVEYLTNKYEVTNAVYENSGAQAIDDEGKPQEFAAFTAKGEGIDAFMVKDDFDSWRKSLVIFFDDEQDLDKMFFTEIKNCEYGAYQYRRTMQGPVLVPVENDNTVTPILDEEMLDNLKRDTKVFFSEKTEKFFSENNLPHKRGILIWGPPGNGKTTFIKNFCSEHVKEGYAILCESQDFESGMGPFLKQTLGKDANKIVVFEDVDSIGYCWERRSEFLNFLDGVNTLHKCLFVATTNYPGRLDSALLKRPSRFDQKYFIGLPDIEMRKKFLKSFFKDIDTNTLNKAAEMSDGFSGAMFKEVFILTGLRDIGVIEATKVMIKQMEELKVEWKKKEDKEIMKDIFMKSDEVIQREFKAKAARVKGMYGKKQKALVPTDSMSREEKEASQKQRSKQYGIEILDGAALTFPKGYPTELEQYGDPVNLKYPVNTKARAANARVRFKQNASEYSKTSSKRVVHNRIVEAELKQGIVPDIDPNDALDKLLSASLRRRAQEAAKKKKKSRKGKLKKVAEFDVCKQDKKQRLVYGPILIPENVDLQDDIISAEDIQKAAHGYMVKLAFKDDLEFLESIGMRNNKSKRGFMHTEFNRKIAFVESYIAPTEFKLGDRTIKEGTWVGVAKVFDDEVWSLVEAGKIRGFSIGGRSKARKEKVEE